MQINAINSTNFGSTIKAEGQKSLPALPPDIQEQLTVLDKLADKAKSDVHPSTIVATVVAVATAALSVRKVIPYARRFAVTLGEEATKLIAKVSSEVANKFKKQDKIDVNRVLDSIASKADKLRDGNPDSKLVEKITKFASKISGKSSEDLADLTKGLEKAGIKNGVDAFDTALALGAGALTLDPVSDKVEEHNDTKDIIEGIAEFLG